MANAAPAGSALEHCAHETSNPCVGEEGAVVVVVVGDDVVVVEEVVVVDDVLVDDVLVDDVAVVDEVVVEGGGRWRAHAAGAVATTVAFTRNNATALAVTARIGSCRTTATGYVLSLRC